MRRSRGCPSAWHPGCLDLPGVPFGRWECPLCVRAPGRKSFDRWPPQKRGPGKGAKASAANVLADSDEEEEPEDED